MWKLIQLVPSSPLERKWKEELKDIKPKTLDEYVNETLSVRNEVAKVLSPEIPIVKVKEKELLIILKNSIKDALVKRWDLSSELFLCWEYVWYIIHECMMWNLEINKYTQDFFDENMMDFKSAWDINLLKYIYEFHRRRHEINTARDYIERAWIMYYNAYSKWQMELWYTLAYNLEDLDSKISLAWIAERIFVSKTDKIISV